MLLLFFTAEQPCCEALGARAAIASAALLVVSATE